LKPETRAIGMGILYTLYYATMMLGPVVAGALAKSTGQAGSAFDFGTAVILVPVRFCCGPSTSSPEARPKVA
jgi:hypothetical protein